MARRKLTEAMKVATRKTELSAARWRRKLAIMAGDETAKLWKEHHILVGEVRKDDIVFPEPGTRPFVAAVDAFPSTGPIEGLIILRDQQTEDHYYPGGKTVEVLREHTEEDSEPELESDRPPWEIDDDDD